MLLMAWFWLGYVEAVVVKASEWLGATRSKAYPTHDFISFYWLCVYMYLID